MTESPKKYCAPIEELPEYWQDEDRINVLFAPFRSKQVNSKDWDTKLEFWKQTIFVYCSHNKTFSFKLADLQTAFTYGGRRPICLEIVLQEMQQANDIILIDDFLKNVPQTWGGWAAEQLVKKPLVWSFDKVKKSLFAMEISNQLFVHLKSIKENARSLLETLPEEYKNNVINLKDFEEFYTKCNSENLKLVLHYLKNHGDLATREIQRDKNKETTTLIKFRTNTEIKKLIISDSDVDIYVLKQSEKVLIDSLEKLEKESMDLIKTVKQQLLNGHKHMAKTSLKRKHDLEKRIQSKANALHNVQTLLSTVEDVGYDADIIDSYKVALDSIKKNFKENNINDDSVSNTMADIADIIDEHNDIQATLAQPVVEFDADLEAELEELLAAEDDNTNTKPSDSPGNAKNKIENDKDKHDEELELPDVPKDIPTVAALNVD